MNRNVLVVEDDDAIRRLLLEYFRLQPNLTVEGARDGADALHAVNRKRFGVVLLDLMMPYMSGIDFLDSLSVIAREGRPDLPRIIVITGAAQQDLPSEQLSARFPQFVRCVHRKPLDLSALGDCITAEMQ